MWLIVGSFGALVGSAICNLSHFEAYVQPLWATGIVLALLWGSLLAAQPAGQEIAKRASAKRVGPSR